MGRPSKLTDKQWHDLERRFLSGEPGRALSREYKISEAAIRKRIGTQAHQIKAVANQLVAAEAAFSALPIGAQISARTLADELKEISTHLAGAARFGAATAHRLNGIAHAKAVEVDDATPLDDDSRKVLGDIAVLNRMANDASQIGVNLLRANKDHVDAVNAAAREESSKPDTGAQLRPQLTRKEWMDAHGVGTTARAAE